MIQRPRSIGDAVAGARVPARSGRRRRRRGHGRSGETRGLGKGFFIPLGRGGRGSAYGEADGDEVLRYSSDSSPELRKAAAGRGRRCPHQSEDKQKSQPCQKDAP